MTVTSLELAKVAALAADSKKAEDIVLLDLTPMTDVCDYFLICTGANARLVDAIVDEVRDKVRTNCGESPISTEGRDGLRWVLGLEGEAPMEEPDVAVQMAGGAE